MILGLKLKKKKRKLKVCLSEDMGIRLVLKHEGKIFNIFEQHEDFNNIFRYLIGY